MKEKPKMKPKTKGFNKKGEAKAHRQVRAGLTIQSHHEKKKKGRTKKSVCVDRDEGRQNKGCSHDGDVLCCWFRLAEPAKTCEVCA